MIRTSSGRSGGLGGLVGLLLVVGLAALGARLASAGAARADPGSGVPATAPDLGRVGHNPISCAGEVCQDHHLQLAVELLAGMATRLDARLTGSAVRAALGLAGYPGDARVSMTRGGDAFPVELQAGEPPGLPRDVAVASRRFVGVPEPATLWIYAWAPRRLVLDPVPRDLAPGEPLTLLLRGPGPLELLVTRPDGTVDDLAISPGRPRILSQLAAGEHRLEVLRDEQVELVFSVWVASRPPRVGTLPGPAPSETAEAVAAGLRARAAALRAEAGLPPLTPFPEFEPLADDQARCLAALGRIEHDGPTCPSVARRAKASFFPLAHLSEDLARAPSTDEAWGALLASPGHRRNLLCAACTHDALAVVRGPDRELWVVWEFLAFPSGVPRAGVAPVGG